MPNDFNIPKYDIVIGSREATGSIRYNEPFYRHIYGKIFNFSVKTFMFSGINDTQCGFKLFTKKSAQMNPGWVSALWLLSAALAEQGDVEGAKDLVDQILVLDETTSITKISNSLMINSPLLMESLMNGLRKAGLPEE